MWGFLTLATFIIIVVVAFKVAKKYNLALPPFLKSILFWKTVGIALGVILLLILLGYGANYVWDNRVAITPYASAVLALLVLVVMGILRILKKVGTAGTWALGTLAVLILLFGVRTPEAVMNAQGIVSAVVLDGKPVFVTEKVEQPEKVAPPTHRGTVTWNVYAKDGTVLAHVWSNEAKGVPGCRMDVSYHDSFKAQTCYHSKECSDYVPGTSPNVTAWRFMATVPGLTAPTYVHRC